MALPSRENQGISFKESRGFFGEERVKTIIGLILILLILAGTGLLIYLSRKSSSQNKTVIDQGQLENLKGEVASLNGQIEELNKKLAEQGTETRTSVSTSQKEMQGRVAGARTEEPSSNSSQPPASEKAIGKINLNTASASQLDSLPGIGPAYAGRIIEYRNSHGGFKSIEEVKNVKGIGDKTFLKFKDLITI